LPEENVNPKEDKMTKIRTYFASGWFTKNQQSTYEQLKEILDTMDETFEVFYPKHASADLQGNLSDPKVRAEIFEKNVRAIDQADLVICSTEDKDTGSIMEAGYATAKSKPIVYANFHLGDAPFNLMLTESGIAIAKTAETFLEILQLIKSEGLESPKLQQYLEQDAE